MARKLGMQTKFLPNLRSKMHYYDINRVKLSREQKVQTLLNQVEDMRSVMDKNIRLMMEHQEGQLDDMIEKSDIMKQDAVVFKKKAEIILLASKRRLFIRNFSCTFFALGFIYLILALGCGFTFQACRV
jgi:Synaptobrevin